MKLLGKYQFFFVAGMIALMTPSLAYAGGSAVYNATITGVGATNFTGTNGSVPFFVYLNQNGTNWGCNSSTLSSFAIDSTTAAGKAMIATILMAQATGQTISVTGTGTCSIWGLSESANGVSVN